MVLINHRHPWRLIPVVHYEWIKMANQFLFLRGVFSWIGSNSLDQLISFCSSRSCCCGWIRSRRYFAGRILSYLFVTVFVSRFTIIVSCCQIGSGGYISIIIADCILRICLRSFGLVVSLRVINLCQDRSVCGSGK